MAHPDRSGGQPDHEAHRNDGEVEGGRSPPTTPNCDNGSKGRFVFTLTPVERHEVQHGRRDDDNVPSFNIAAVMYFRIGTPAANVYAPTMYKMAFAS